MRELRITVGVAAALMAGACGSRGDRWTADQDTAVCVDQQGRRVPDAQCPRERYAYASPTGSPFLWYYLGRQSALPYYGDRVVGGSFRPASGHNYALAPASLAMTRSAATSRGLISRGGFGSSARAAGGAGE